MRNRKFSYAFLAVLLMFLLMNSCTDQDEFAITGEWEIYRAMDSSGENYSTARSFIWTFSGTAADGEITGTGGGFFTGSYHVEGRTVTIDTWAGRGPEWLQYQYHGVFTGENSMQGSYEGSSGSGSQPGAEPSFSGKWWAARKK